MKRLFTLGEKIWLIYTVLFAICIGCFIPETSVITLSLVYIITYCAILGITMLIKKTKT